MVINIEREITLSELLETIQSIEISAIKWDDEEHKNALAEMRNAVDALHKETLKRMILILRQNPESTKMLKEAASDNLVYAVLRHHELIKPSLDERVEQALDSVRPMLAGHGGNVQLVSVALPIATIKLMGTCNGCPAADLTLSEGIEKAIKEYCPEITEIKTVKGLAKASCSDGGLQFISPFANKNNHPWKYLAKLDEVPEGEYKIVDLEEGSFILSRDGEQISCYLNSCAHLGFKLDNAAVSEGIITCPFHGFRYALNSGECLTVPEVQLQICAIRIIDNHVEVQIDQ